MSDFSAFLGLFGIAVLLLIHALIYIPRKRGKKMVAMIKKHMYTVIGTGVVVDGRLEITELSSKMADLSSLHKKSNVLIISTDEDIPDGELGTKYHLEIPKG